MNGKSSARSTPSSYLGLSGIGLRGRGSAPARGGGGGGRRRTVVELGIEVVRGRATVAGYRGGWGGGIQPVVGGASTAGSRWGRIVVRKRMTTTIGS
jgi:hypothetical protein